MDCTLRLLKPNQLIRALSLSLFFFAFSAFRFENTPAYTTAEVEQMRHDITGWAQNFVGIKYRHAGVSPRTGFDCSGFTSYVMKEFDVRISPGSSTQSTQGIKIGLDEVKAGDLVFFGRRGRIQHVAMVVERTEEGIICVHSTNTRGVVVENINTSAYWRPRILFARDVISPQLLSK